MGVNERKLREKEARAKAILDAAESLFFERGLDGTSMDDVAKKTELSKGTLYLYFTNKNALYRAVLRRAYTSLLKTIQAKEPEIRNGLDATMLICETYIEFAYQQPGYFQAIAHYHSDTVGNLSDSSGAKEPGAPAGNEVLQLFAGQIQRGLNDGSIAIKVDNVVSALLLWGQYTGVLQMLISKQKLLEHYYQIKADPFLETLLLQTRSCLENKH
ncbi:MAG TPA: TetR/AcrR family transcriptional regulator [Luteibaculaceae bacterium]|nr:TetR/AcrR family transcriptional regulator [Luteibaculaceae bacterium]